MGARLLSKRAIDAWRTGLSAKEIHIDVDGGAARIAGTLTVPETCKALVVFAHGSGSSRHSPRNMSVATGLNAAGIATLLADLLTEAEEKADSDDLSTRFDVGLLASRLLDAARWSAAQLVDRRMPVGFFGASTGAAAAIVAAASWPDHVFAIVSRGGRPDLAGDALGKLRSPTLFIVGGADPIVLDLNRHAAKRISCEVRLEVVSRATHLFEESGALEQVTDLARRWFTTHLRDVKTGGRRNLSDGG